MMKVLMKIFHFFLPNGKQEYYMSCRIAKVWKF